MTQEKLSRLAWFSKYWRLGIHLVFRTKHFGVNGAWWSKSESLWGLGWWGKLKNVLLVTSLWRNYRNLKWRMGHTMGLVPQEEYEILFGKEKKF